jgi:hypothetical protein
MADLVSIWNLALAHVGEGTQVSDPEESTTVARVCRTAWDQARDAVLAAYPWAWARRVISAVAYDTAPLPWAYAYLMPADLVTMLQVVPTWADQPVGWAVDWQPAYGGWYLYDPQYTSRIPWEIMGATDEDGLDTPLVVCDAPLASLVYTRKVETTTLYPPPVVDAMSARLAFDICIPLSRSSEIRTLLWSMAQARLQDAMAADARRRWDRAAPDAESILARTF